jgi:hypothetical protein
VAEVSTLRLIFWVPFNAAFLALAAFLTASDSTKERTVIYLLHCLMSLSLLLFATGAMFVGAGCVTKKEIKEKTRQTHQLRHRSKECCRFHCCIYTKKLTNQEPEFI